MLESSQASPEVASWRRTWSAAQPSGSATHQATHCARGRQSIAGGEALPQQAESTGSTASQPHNMRTCISTSATVVRSPANGTYEPAPISNSSSGTLQRVGAVQGWLDVPGYHQQQPCTGHTAPSAQEARSQAATSCQNATVVAQPRALPTASGPNSRPGPTHLMVAVSLFSTWRPSVAASPSGTARRNRTPWLSYCPASCTSSDLWRQRWQWGV